MPQGAIPPEVLVSNPAVRTLELSCPFLCTCARPSFGVPLFGFFCFGGFRSIFTENPPAKMRFFLSTNNFFTFCVTKNKSHFRRGILSKSGEVCEQSAAGICLYGLGPFLLRIPLPKCDFFRHQIFFHFFCDKNKSHFCRGILSKSGEVCEQSAPRSVQGLTERSRFRPCAQMLGHISVFEKRAK